MKKLIGLVTLVVFVGAQPASDKDLGKGRWWLNAADRDRSIYLTGFSDGFSHAANILTLTGRTNLVETYARCLDETSNSDLSLSVTKYVRTHAETLEQDRMLVILKAFGVFCDSRASRHQ